MEMIHTLQSNVGKGKSLDVGVVRSVAPPWRGEVDMSCIWVREDVKQKLVRGSWRTLIRVASSGYPQRADGSIRKEEGKDGMQKEREMPVVCWVENMLNLLESEAGSNSSSKIKSSYCQGA